MRCSVLLIWFAALATALDGAAEENPLVGKPVVGRNADGQLEIFKINEAGELMHRWQKQSTGDWSSWGSLGGSVLPGICVVNNAEGQMEVFAVERLSHSLAYTRQETTNGLDWSGWTSLGGTVNPPLAAGQESDGRLELFAVDDSSGAVKRRCQNDDRDGWLEWADLGGSLEPKLGVAQHRDGRLELFGIDATTKTLVHCWEQHVNDASHWSQWSNLGGPKVNDFALGENTVGRLEVFVVVATNGTVNRTCQISANSSSEWTPWIDFGRKVKAGIAVGKSADGRMEVFGVDIENDALLHRWENFTNSSDVWSSWTSMGMRAQPYPGVGQNEDGNLEVFAEDLTNGATINHRRQISHASDWLDWSSLDHRTFQYNSRTWQIDEGLPDNAVLALAQTPDGYLWVGTHSGLARFDGLQFTTFNSRNTPELWNSSITALCADREGTLWIGTEGGGLVRLREGVFSHFGKTDGLAGDSLKVIYERKDGSLWIGSTTGISRYQDGKISNYTKKEGLASDMVSSIYEDSSSNLWIATGEGLNRLKGETMESFAMPDGLPGDSVRGICQDKGGRVWIGSNNGMLWYDWYWYSHFYAYNSRYGLSDTFVSAICEDREGNLWVGTYSGLNRFHEGRFFNQLNREGFPFGRVNALSEDREGNLWVASSEGLTRLTPERFFTYTRRQGLTHNNVTSVMEDHNGNLWIDTWGGGLDRLKDEKFTAYATTNGLSQSLVLSTCEGRDGSLWIGADFDGGLTRSKEGRIMHYTWRDGLPNAGLRVLHEDGSGKLWIGTSKGLCCFKDGKFSTYTTRDGLCGDAVHAICEDRAGRFWIGTERGLNCWNGNNFNGFKTDQGLSDDSVLALYEDKNADLWIGTAGGGLDRYRGGRFSRYTTQQGLFSDEIFEILEDDDGWLWMSCSKGVFRVRKKDLDALDRGECEHFASVVYGKSDGMESPQCSGVGKPGAWKSRDGRLWFATSKGLVTVDPKTTRINLAPPPVYIEQVSADRKTLANALWQAKREKASKGPKPPVVVVPPGRGELEFHYTALNLQAPENCRFKYKLAGLDVDWIDAGTRRVAHYNNVYPDRYDFQVIACNKDGVWNESGASLALELQPHVWQTGWLRALGVLVAIAGTGGLARYITARRLRRRLELLEQRHAIDKERARIAKDMHDQIGAGLTQAGLLGELTKRDADKVDKTKRHANELCDVVRELAQTLDEIVWTVNPKNDSLNKLAAYMAVYAEDYFGTASIRCRLDIPAGLPPHPLSAELRHNLFLTVKEAFNNVVKHAGASEVWLRFCLEAFALRISIEDNGRGFAVETTNATGNGLSNMKERIEELGGRFSLISLPGKGTEVSIRVKLAGIQNDSHK